MRWPRALEMLIRGVAPVVAAVAVAAVAAAAEDAPVTKVKLGFDNQTPGKEVAIALIIDVTSGAEVGSATADITFPTRMLTFQQVRPNIVAQTTGTEIRTEVKKDGPVKGTSVITVTATAKKGESLSTGALADLVFTIAKDAPVGDSIDVKLAAKAFAVGDATRPVAPVMTEDGTIRVTDFAPVITCFFYMH